LSNQLIASFTPPPLTWKAINWPDVRQRGSAAANAFAKATLVAARAHTERAGWNGLSRMKETFKSGS